MPGEKYSTLSVFLRFAAWFFLTVASDCCILFVMDIAGSRYLRDIAPHSRFVHGFANVS